MAYLNEDGLETLVGKIKGQVVELTSAEYEQLPATKNTDNKLYFVTDEAYAYQIDDEPTANSSGLVKSGGVYNWTSKIGSGTLTTTAQTLIPAVNELDAAIDTINTAIDTINAGLANIKLGYSLVERVAFPFTAKADGILTLTCAPGGTATSYLYINEDGSSIARGYNNGNGGPYTLTFPIRKGSEYTVSASSNAVYVRNPTAYYFG